MNKYRIKLIFIISLFYSFPFCETVKVINNLNSSSYSIRTLDRLSGTYISIIDFSKILTNRDPYINEDRGKMVLYIGDKRVKISSYSSFVLVDEQVYQMPVYPIWINNDIYISVDYFIDIIKRTTLPGINYDPKTLTLSLDIQEYTINSVDISQKANGTILRIKTKKSFPDGNISSFFHENGWFYITISGGLVDTTEFRRSDIRGVISNIAADQLDQTAQLAFQIRSKVEGHELYQSKDQNEIVVSLRTPMDNSVSRINKVRDRWKLDTIVLDAGHGGKDPGTSGRRGTKEKDIALDIVKRVGMPLEKNTK